jgi:hypothetical protein
MRQTLLVKLVESNRVIPIEEYYLTKLVYPISYGELANMEKDLIRLAKRHKRADAYLVLPSDSEALKGKATTFDPFLPNTGYVYKEEEVLPG